MIEVKLGPYLEDDRIHLNDKNKIIPVNSIKLNGNENKYLKNCIKDNWISSGGKYNYLFEKIKNHIKKICYICNKRNIGIRNSNSSFKKKEMRLFYPHLQLFLA